MNIYYVSNKECNESDEHLLYQQLRMLRVRWTFIMSATKNAKSQMNIYYVFRIRWTYIMSASEAVRKYLGISESEYAALHPISSPPSG